MPLVRRVLATLAVACAEREAVAAVTTASPCLPLLSSGSALKAAALVLRSQSPRERLLCHASAPLV